VAIVDSYESYGLKHEAMVHTKYKTVTKKLVVTQLPSDTNEHIRQAETALREARQIGHKFTKETREFNP